MEQQEPTGKAMLEKVDEQEWEEVEREDRRKNAEPEIMSMVKIG